MSILTEIQLNQATERLTTKEQFFSASRAGRCGNFLRMWDSAKEAEKACRLGGTYITIRSPYRAGRTVLLTQHPMCWNMPPGSIYQEVPPPILRRAANLELSKIYGDWWLYWEPDTLNPVRGIRERVAPIRGLAALATWRSLRDESVQTIEELFDVYGSDAVIEATEFESRVGMLQQHLVIWEVRHY